jgi:hypothetical protein
LLTCPVTEGGVICSVCCSSHSTCGDVCKRGMERVEVGGGRRGVVAASSGD